ncbi:hypothetical protein VNO77_27214 [Canavalia gladiata]|uniref:Uncharacterized protein n=1 Tax=Canavalia gladiata TaxID=3824 RepID=A0AAN9KXF8_CANGL
MNKTGYKNMGKPYEPDEIDIDTTSRCSLGSGLDLTRRVKPVDQDPSFVALPHLTNTEISSMRALLITDHAKPISEQ